MKRIFAFRLVWFILLLALALGHSQAQTQNKTLIIPTAEKAPVIDGDGQDWSGIPATEIVSADGKARLKFSRDAANFHALVEVEDASPLKNGADRAEEMIKGGDAVAFYFGMGKGTEQRVAFALLQGKETAYVYRPVSPVKKPHVFASPAGEARFDFVAPLEGAKVRFRKEEKGSGGYTMEVALPWKSLGMVPPPPDSFAFDAQIIFSDPGGTQNMGAVWLFAREGPGLTIEDLPTEAKLYPETWGRVALSSSAVSPAEVEVRSQNHAGEASIEVNVPRAGRLSLNITDDQGWILRELVMAEKVSAGKQIFKWDGRDRYGEPLPPGNYPWKALLFDGMRTEFMGSVGNSGRPPYRTDDGLGSMGGQHGAQKSVASDEGGVYMANALQEGPPVMRKIDPLTGKAFWMRSAGSFKSVDGVAAGDGMLCYLNGLGKKEGYLVDLVRIDPATGNDVPMGANKSRVRLEVPASGKPLPGLAIVDGKAYFSVTEENRIGVIDLKSGEKEKDLSVNKPKGLTRLDGKTLLVCSEGTVLALDVAGGSAVKKIEGLKEARAVAVEPGGNLLVSDLGDSQQIKRFSADGKKLLASWGKEGGKQNEMNPYDPMAFRNVTGLTMDAKGAVWLAESDPLVRRYVKLSAEGKWLEDFYGPVAYNAFGPDLDDFSRVYYTISDAVFIETVLDYDHYRKDPEDPAKGWKIVATHDLGLGADGKTRNEAISGIADTGYGHVTVFRGKNGKRYFFRPSKSNRAVSPAGAALWVENQGRWVPCALVSENAEKVSSWADQNGDGLIQPEEESKGPLPITEVAWIDRDLTLHGFEGKLAPASVSEAGVPKYDGGTFSPYLAKGGSSQVGDGWTFCSPEVDGAVYYISNHGPHRHLSFWDRATENRLIKIKDGKVQWITGKHDPKPGFVEFSTNSGIAGIVDGIVLVQNIEPCNYIAYTEDGFVLGDIMVDKDGNHPKVGPYVINIESFTGLFAKDPKSGKNLLFAVSSGDDRILEVQGPGKTDRLSGTVILPPSASPSSMKNWTVPYSTWYGNAGRDFKIDGEATEWNPEVPVYSVVQDGKNMADLQLRRDAGELNFFAAILDPLTSEQERNLRLVFTNGTGGEAVYEWILTLVKNEKGGWSAKSSLLGNGKELAPPVAKAAVTERWKGLGYRIEASLPMGLLGEFSEDREQKFRRISKGEKEIKEIAQKLPDLKEPLAVEIFLNGKSLGKTALVIP